MTQNDWNLLSNQWPRKPAENCKSNSFLYFLPGYNHEQILTFDEKLLDEHPNLIDLKVKFNIWIRSEKEWPGSKNDVIILEATDPVMDISEE